MARQYRAGTRNQSKDSEHHERSLQSRDAGRVDGQESDPARSPKRKEGAHSRCTRTARTSGAPRQARRPGEDFGPARRGHRLRVSELLALRWDDIDFTNLEIRVTESIRHQVLGVCKTEASAKPVPMDAYMAEDLKRWRKTCAYPMDTDWVFASPRMKGKQPYWPDNLMKRYIKPAAEAAGITKNIGWHTFRHSFGNIAEGKRRRCEDRSGALASRKQQDHARRLHAGRELA